MTYISLEASFCSECQHVFIPQFAECTVCDGPVLPMQLPEIDPDTLDSLFFCVGSHGYALLVVDDQGLHMQMIADCLVAAQEAGIA